MTAIRRFAYAIAFVFIFFMGMGVGTYWHPGFFFNEWYPGYFFQKIISVNPSPTDFSEQGTHYTFVNPLLFCQDQNISGFTDAAIIDVQDDIENYIQDQTDSGELKDAGIYYKDLNNGPSFSVNASLQFAPASLLKIPTAMSVYKHAEVDPDFVKQKVFYPGGGISNASQYFAPPETIVPNTTYTIEDLVRYMVQDSDNTALSLLGSKLNTEELSHSYTDLGIALPSAPQPAYQISVKTYASFFRVLFNASYLSAGDSEHLLSLLAGSKFTEGLVAGVPGNIKIAHKFGEYTLSAGSYQLYDCGIVYAPREPYLLCVMTRGGDYDALAKIIAHISKLIYDSVISH